MKVKKIDAEVRATVELSRRDIEILYALVNFSTGEGTSPLYRSVQEVAHEAGITMPDTELRAQCRYVDNA